jgi:hypothetical protein
VEKFFREMETGAERAYPDNEMMADTILEFSLLSPAERFSKSVEARQGAITRYDWDDTAQNWMSYIDFYEPTGKQGVWDSLPIMYQIPDKVPVGMNHEGFVRWLYETVLREPERAQRAPAMQMLRDLNYGARVSQGSLEPCTVDQLFKEFTQRANHKIMCEQVRAGRVAPSQEYFIDEAYKRKKS